MTNKSYADLVAYDMNNIISSNEFKNIFARPTVKTASVNEKDCADTKDVNDANDKKCAKCDDVNCVCDANEVEIVASAIDLLVKASERLDRVDGFDKSAAHALYTLEVIAKEAAKKVNKDKDSKSNKKDDKKDDKKDKDKKEDKKNDKKEDKSKGKKPEDKKKSKNVKKANIDTDINDVSLTAELLGEDQISAFDDEIEDPNSSEIAGKLLLNTPGLIDSTRKRLSLLDDDLDFDIHSDLLFDDKDEDEDEDENEDDIALPPPPIVPNDFRETVPAKPRKDASINRKAFMGHPYSDSGDKNYSGNIKLWKVYIDLDGYEQPGGSYWGVGEPLWRYESDDEARERGEYVYGNVRAWDREEAEELVRAKYPNANILPEDPADVAEYEEQEQLDLISREEDYTSIDDLEDELNYDDINEKNDLNEFDKHSSNKLNLLLNKYATYDLEKAYTVGYELNGDTYCKDCFDINGFDKDFAEEIHIDDALGLTCKECDTDLNELDTDSLLQDDEISNDLSNFDMIDVGDSQMTDNEFRKRFGLTRDELKDIDNEYFDTTLDELNLLD